MDSTSKKKYVGKERRRTCTDCTSHREHSLAINTLKERNEKLEIGNGEVVQRLDQKVSYANFKWAFGIVMSVIVVVSTINYTTSRNSTRANYDTMNRILDSNHQVEKEMVAVNSEIKSINDKLLLYSNRMVMYHDEHKFFRAAILALMDNNKINPQINGD